jgi:purine-nucleoside phosphorylase
MSEFAAFHRRVQQRGPRAAIVLGSGLAEALNQFREDASLGFGDVPGLARTTVVGHPGRLVLGSWDEIPLVLVLGRHHFYEGHPPHQLTGCVRIIAGFGVPRIILTNAAGGIHPALHPGDVMAIRSHIKLIGPDAWRRLVQEPASTECNPYSPRLIELAAAAEANEDRPLLSGRYAALTGPSYETPAEIRALAFCGVDAVGMSTALEAEAAAEQGLEVLGLSCVTNPAAGLAPGSLSHAEVLHHARLAGVRLEQILSGLLKRL